MTAGREYIIVFDANGDYGEGRHARRQRSIMFRALTLLVVTTVFLLGADLTNAQTGLARLRSVCVKIKTLMATAQPVRDLC